MSKSFREQLWISPLSLALSHQGRGDYRRPAHEGRGDN